MAARAAAAILRFAQPAAGSSAASVSSHQRRSSGGAAAEQCVRQQSGKHEASGGELGQRCAVSCLPRPMSMRNSSMPSDSVRLQLPEKSMLPIAKAAGGSTAAAVTKTRAVRAGQVAARTRRSNYQVLVLIATILYMHYCVSIIVSYCVVRTCTAEAVYEYSTVLELVPSVNHFTLIANTITAKGGR